MPRVAEKKAGIAEEAGETGAVCGGLEGVRGAAFWFAHEEPEGEGDEDAGSGGDVEGHAPAVAFAEDAAEEIAESSADGDGDVENAQDTVTIFFRIEVGEEGGGKDGEGGLTDADGSVADEQRVVAVNGGGEEGGSGPDEGSGDDEGFARETVAEPAGGGGDPHISEEECRGEEPGLRIVDMKFALDEGLDAGEHVAVNEVEEVESREEKERESGGTGGVGMVGWRGHRVWGRIAGT